jgi:hypothetical protein
LLGGHFAGTMGACMWQLGSMYYLFGGSDSRDVFKDTWVFEPNVQWNSSMDNYVSFTIIVSCIIIFISLMVFIVFFNRFDRVTPLNSFFNATVSLVIWR